MRQAVVYKGEDGQWVAECLSLPGCVSVELDLGNGGFADRWALRFDEFDDLHGGFESDGCRGVLVTQNVSKSVECEVGESAELVQEEFGSVVAGSEQGAGEGGVFLGPEVDG